MLFDETVLPKLRKQIMFGNDGLEISLRRDGLDATVQMSGR